MASALIEQLKGASDDGKRAELLHNIELALFSGPGQPLDANFAQNEFVALCSLQSEDSPVVSIWLLHNLADLCRKEDVCMYFNLRSIDTVHKNVVF